MFRAVSMIVALSFEGAALANEVSGIARVLDGDTIEVGSTKVRSTESTRRKALSPAGARPGSRIPAAMPRRTGCVNSQPASPSPAKEERDQYGRLLAVCSVGGRAITRCWSAKGLPGPS